MQDRFKFRAWDNQERYYIPDEETNFCHGMMEYWLDKEDCPLVFEQCTGMKDKNGKLIYEGDIVNCSFSGKANTVETFAKKVFQGKHIVEFCEYYFAPFNCVNASDVEVIGNIHKNPELLK